MKSKRTFRSLAAICLVVLSHSARADDQYWNPPGLNGNWNTTETNWTGAAWTNGNSAIFDQLGTYTVTTSGALTADTVNLSAGTITFAGTGGVKAATVIIGADATVVGPADRFIGSGTTALKVNGVLSMSVVSSSNNRVTISGNGTIANTGGSGLRLTGANNFSGNIESTTAMILDSGTLNLSGTNTYTGDTLLRSSAGTLRLSSAGALSPNSFLRFGTGTNIVELASGDFSRTLGSSAGNVRFADSTGLAGFAAIGGDRTVALTGSLVWTSAGGTTFNPTQFVLGNSNSTNKVTLTSDLNLGGGVRIISSGDDTSKAVAVEGEISGIISNGSLTKSGTGTLELSGSNTFAGAVSIAGGGGAQAGWLRLSNSNALGLAETVKTINFSGSTNAATGGIELIGGVTIANKNLQLGGRDTDATDRSALRNVSGNNAWNGDININNAGGTYFISSQAGRLELGGNLSNQAGGVRAFNLIGAGDFLLSGAVTDKDAATKTSLVMAGEGTATLTGSGHTFSGGAAVTSGTLVVNGVLSNASVTIATGATLGGSGEIGGDVSVAGILAPGNSIESLATGSIAFTDGSTFASELDSNALNADLLASSGAFTLAGTVTLDLSDLAPGVAAPGSKLTLLSYTDGWDPLQLFTYESSLLADDSVIEIGANRWRFDYNDNTPGSNFAADQAGAASFVTLTAVPEPASVLLGGLGLLALFRRRRA